MLKSMRAALFIIVMFVSLAGGITLSYYAERPRSYPGRISTISPQSFATKTTLYGTITSVDTVTKTIHFEAVSPYALGETLPLRVMFDDQTHVELLKDRQKNESAAVYLALHGVAARVRVEIRSDPGVLYTYSINESGMKRQ